MVAGVHTPGGPLHERFGPHCGRAFGTFELEMTPIKSIFIIEARGDQRTRSMDAYIPDIPTYILVEQFLEHRPILNIGGPLDFEMQA